MKFTKLADTLHPADDEAMSWLMNAEEGDSFEAAAKPRTITQNNAIWKYCEMLGSALNDAGFDMRTYPLKPGLSLPWTKDAVMRVFWRPVQDALLGKESTRALSTKEVNHVYEALDRANSERTGVHVEFPSREH